MHWAKQDNVDEYTKICDKYSLFNKTDDDDDFIFEQNNNVCEIKQNYLLMDKKLGTCPVSKYINNFLTGDIKTINIFSPYNTGKTTLLTEICSKFKKILFISYRITLTNNLMGNFKKLGFKTYFDDIESDRLICQVDSLDKITNVYDLIIIDEIESVLNHFCSPTLTNQKFMFDTMVELCAEAKKIINLDGDLGARTITFSNIFGEYNLIKNTIQKDTKEFIMHCEENVFNDLIKRDLEQGKNVCIISMSSKNASYYYELYKEQYKTILYTSKTSDKDKKLLAEVENIWSNHQLIIYSPCIEAGVDYNIEHFDKIYLVLASESTSQRGLNQMINRIRQIKDNKIHTFLNTIPANETSIRRHYNFDEIKAFYNNLMDKDEIMVKNNNKLEVKQNFSFYDIIKMYNTLEKLNKNSNCFLPIFIKMIKNKGHSYKFYDDSRKVKKVKKDNMDLEKIVNATRINDDTYKNLLIEQSKHNLTTDQKYQLQKFIYEHKFNMQIDDLETMKKLSGKLEVIKNFNRLLIDEYRNENEIDTVKLKELNKKYDTIKQILKVYNIIPKDLINDTCIIDYETLAKTVEPINKIATDNKILFNLNKTIKIESTTKLLGTLNSILDNYGIFIKSKRKGKTHVKQYEFYLMDEVKINL